MPFTMSNDQWTVEAIAKLRALIDKIEQRLDAIDSELEYLRARADGATWKELR